MQRTNTVRDKRKNSFGPTHECTSHHLPIPRRKLTTKVACQAILNTTGVAEKELSFVHISCFHQYSGMSVDKISKSNFDGGQRDGSIVLGDEADASLPCQSPPGQCLRTRKKTD
mmetsp:Transcript_17198/g.29606  ORF Transcript_17198/g.29606 Transcript_17198/m.29606 type:complete len:114 (+) Transcript_17198:366-707(+)